MAAGLAKGAASSPPPPSGRTRPATADGSSTTSGAASLSVNVRVSQPGWAWSGAIRIGDADPGEMLVKVSWYIGSLLLALIAIPPGHPYLHL